MDARAGILKIGVGPVHMKRIAVLVCILAFELGGTPALIQAARGEPAGAAEPQSLSAQGSSDRTRVRIPGSLASFLRMAAISQKALPEEVLPFLARNVSVEGCVYVGEKPQRPTEFLTLLKDYLDQARELQALAGLGGMLEVNTCEEAAQLITIIGYQFRTPCGPGTSLETLDPKKAFLAIDSGFPLVELEEALRQNTTFTHSVLSTDVPVLFEVSDWAGEEKSVLDTLLDDPRLARLYWALARLDEGTRRSLKGEPGIEALLPVASILDFYGSHIQIRNGRVLVPGGSGAERGWRNLVGSDLDEPGEFVQGLLEKDEGWLAAYFDTLGRIPRSQQTYFTEPNRLRRFYEALRGRDLSPSPARPVFRPVAGLQFLLSRTYIGANGQPHIPGNLEVWKEVFRRKSGSRVVRDWARKSVGWNRPEHLMEAMFSVSRVSGDDTPLQVFLLLTEIDRRRPPEQRVSAQTVRDVAANFSRYDDQFTLFTEWPELDDASIKRFIDAAVTLDLTRNKLVRANAVGMFQANLGLWQILARQGQIPREDLNGSFQRVLQPFYGGMRSSEQLFDVTRTSLGEVMRAATGRTDLSQSEMITLLAGPNQTTPDGQKMKQEVAGRMRAVMDAQRLTSIDTLFGLADGLAGMSQGESASDGLMRLAGELREFELPQPIFTDRERSEWASGIRKNPHANLQVKVDLGQVMTRSADDPEELIEARGQLTPFFRDVLVGLNYAYYEPPGAQMLHNNTLLVRSHDFSGQMTPTSQEMWETPRMFGRGWSASGGAHLVGSLSDLPYVLAQIEQDFIVPENVQSLIWADLVPGILTTAVLPRWWRVSADELRAVSLYQQFGEQLVTAAGTDAALRGRIVEILFDRMLPSRLYRFEGLMAAGRGEEIVPEILPSETAFLGAEYRRLYPAEAESVGGAGQELARLRSTNPTETSWERISEDFGVPHPSLGRTYARELLNLKPLPTFLGYSSRLLAETWESSNLYWARLAHEKGYSAVLLNRLVPVLTHRMVEKIFATHLEDWPAVLRAMRETGEEFRLDQTPEWLSVVAAAGL